MRRLNHQKFNISRCISKKYIKNSVKVLIPKELLIKTFGHPAILS